MAIRKTSLKAFLRLTRTRFKKNIPTIKAGAIIGAGGGIGGAAVGFGSAPAGLKSEGGKLGALEGAISGAAAGALGSVVFRRIRGRIIPIRTKKR